LTSFLKILKYQILWKPSRGCQVVPCGRTEGQTGRWSWWSWRFFLQFYEHAEKVW